MLKLKKWVLPAVFGVLGVAAIVLVALASMNASVGGVDSSYKGIVFGCKKIVAIYNGSPVETEVDYGPAVLPLVGWILIVVGVVCGLCVAFLGKKFIKNPKVERIVGLCAALLALVGGVFQFFALRSFAGVLAKEMGAEVEDIMTLFKNANAAVPLCTVGGILGIVGACALAVREFLPEK